MNNGELISKVHNAMYHRLQAQGVVSPVEVLMDIGVLSKSKYEDWRFGRLPYLEAACTVNLKKLSVIMHEMRVYARKQDLKPSISFYKQWGLPKLKGTKQPAVKLRFSKYGDPKVETWYATSFVDTRQIHKLKEQCQQTTKPNSLPQLAIST